MYFRSSTALNNLSDKRIIHVGKPLAIPDIFAPNETRGRRYNGSSQMSYLEKALVKNKNGKFVITIRNKHDFVDPGILVAQFLQVAGPKSEFLIQWIPNRQIDVKVFDTSDRLKSIQSTSNDVTPWIPFSTEEIQYTISVDALAGNLDIYANGEAVDSIGGPGYSLHNQPGSSGLPAVFEGGSLVDEFSIADAAHLSTSHFYYQGDIGKIEVFDGQYWDAATVKEQYYDELIRLRTTDLIDDDKATGYDKPRRAMQSKIVTLNPADDQTGFVDKDFFGIMSFGWDKDYPGITAKIKARYLRNDGSPAYEHIVGDQNGVPIQIDLAQGANGSSFPLNLAATADQINILFSAAVAGDFVFSKAG
jgi:hypothetical protein